jgi:hypothetical protein
MNWLVAETADNSAIVTARGLVFMSCRWSIACIYSVANEVSGITLNTISWIRYDKVIIQQNFSK